MSRSRSKKSNFKPNSWEKDGTANLSSTIYATMLQSPAFLDLSPQAVRLYLYMKLQLFGVKQEDKPNGDNNLFVFNKAMYTKVYPLFSNGEQFNKYCHELIKNGFIEEQENGHTTRTKNIYRFCDGWKNWDSNTDYRPPAMKRKDEMLQSKRQAQRQARSKT